MKQIIDDSFFDDKIEENYEPLDIDFKKYLNIVKENWKRILIWAIVGSLFGIMIGFSKPKVYESNAIVAPEITTRGTSGGLSSLANLAGINMNTMTLTDAMHPELYPLIVKSESFMVRLFDMPVTISTKDSIVHTDLYDYIAHYTKGPWWGVIFGFPHTAAAWVKNLLVEKDEFDDALGYATLKPYKLTKEQYGVVNALMQNISAKIDKKTYALSISVKMQDRDIAAQLTNHIIENLQNFVREYRSNKALETVKYYERVSNETRDEYLKAQNEYAKYLDKNQGFIMKSSLVEQQRLQNEANLRYQMYNQAAQNLLSSKAKVQLESPVIAVIQPGLSPHKGKPSKVKLAMLWFIIGAGLSFVRLCLRKN